MTFMDQFITAAHNYSALILLLLVLLIIRRMYREDRFRQNMFALRDELFDYAAAGKLAFDHPAYTILRTSMNGMIRFAHRVTLTHMLTAYILKRALGTDLLIQNHQRHLEDSFNQVANIEARLRLRDFHLRMQLLLVEHLVKSSLVVFVALSVIILIARLTGATVKLWKGVWDTIPGFDLLEAEAETVGGQ